MRAPCTLRGLMVLGVFSVVGAGVGGAALTGCRTPPTGVHIKVAFTGLPVTQLEFAVFAEDRTTAIVPLTARPQTPGGALPSPQDVVITLPAVRQTVICQARVAGAPGTMREAIVTVAPQEMVDVLLTLTSDNSDAGVDGPQVDTSTDGDDLDAGGELPPSGLENGQPCADATDCASRYCADGVCCSSSCVGLCRACNIPGNVGECTAIADGQPATGDECVAEAASTCGTNGKCDGKGSCQKHTAGTLCQEASCDPTGASLTSASQCDGAGVCVAGQTIACAPFLCDPTSRKCFTSCVATAQCMPGRTCNAQNTCGKKPNGAACSDSDECFTDFCVDGVCCNTACSDSCVSCSQREKEGLCSPLPAGVLDPRGVCRDAGFASCGNNGLCNGVGGCQRYAAGTICANRRCGTNPREEVLARTCDGTGSCRVALTNTCANNFICNSATGSCFSGVCTSNAQCRDSCRAGRCR